MRGGSFKAHGRRSGIVGISRQRPRQFRTQKSGTDPKIAPAEQKSRKSRWSRVQALHRTTRGDPRRMKQRKPRKNDGVTSRSKMTQKDVNGTADKNPLRVQIESGEGPLQVVRFNEKKGEEGGRKTLRR